MDTESILDSTKAKLGIVYDYTIFDAQIIDYINSTFLDLNQLGVGSEDGFSIEDNLSTWDEFVSNTLLMNAVKSYVYLKVRLLFDPPSNSGVVDAINKQIDKLEWRLRLSADILDKGSS